MLKPILLVEDNPNDLELTLLALERSQLANDVVVTRDGAEALDYLHARGTYAGRAPGNPAVVLLDIKMPRLDGIEVLREIRGSEKLKHVPVVILSSSREETDLARSWDLGVNAYVVKPVNASQFFEAVQTLGQFWAVMNEGRPGN